jgi:hypothetical protein
MFFDRSIDNKTQYVDNDGNVLVDLGESIFKGGDIFAGIPFSIYRVADNMDMRSDLVSLAAYGDMENCELLLKYNNIQNPFSIQNGDIIVVPSSVHIQNHVGIKTTFQKISQDSLIRQFHKYIDDKKLPDTPGSEQNTNSIPKTKDIKGGVSSYSGTGESNESTTYSGLIDSNKYKEANLANIGSHAIKEIDGKLYFGADSELKCATNGVNTADYLKTVINNTIKGNKNK